MFLMYETANVQGKFIFLLRHVKFQHSNTIKYSTCIQHVLTDLSQGLNSLDSLNYYNF